MISTILGLAAATFVSEDLACVAAGVLIASGDIPAAAGILACTIGIFAGDCGLWLVGRIGGRAALTSPWLRRRLPMTHLDRCRGWLERNAGKAILASRLTPGARLPLYVTAGVVRMSAWRFAAWTFAASLLWTPVIVLASARAGALGPSSAGIDATALLAAVAVALVLGRAARIAGSPAARATVATMLHRARRWEFWPPWLFYAPVVARVAALALRHRGLTTLTTCNPGFPDGGFAGESKFDILRSLPAEVTVPVRRIEPLPAEPRWACAVAAMRAEGWTFPVVLKPDVGQRGSGVRLIQSARQLRDYLATQPAAVLIQPYHPGPFEAGIFYYRFPHESRGHIFSITDKQFPFIVGDGRSTVAELIHSHPRHRLQSAVFVRRHTKVIGTVLREGERMQLAMAGNHCQGTLFRDGSHLVTPALEERIDQIARGVPGFFIGRFDVRYADVDQFKAGLDLAIVELNGATAESTNIYDPGGSLLQAYRTLFRQWSLVFEIGEANRRAGAVPTSLGRLLRLAAAHLTTTDPMRLSD